MHFSSLILRLPPELHSDKKHTRGAWEKAQLVFLCIDYMANVLRVNQY